MKRAPQIWLVTTTLTMLAIALVLIVAALSAAYLPSPAFYIVILAVGAALSVAIGAIVRWLTSE